MPVCLRLGGELCSAERERTHRIVGDWRCVQRRIRRSLDALARCDMRHAQHTEDLIGRQLDFEPHLGAQSAKPLHCARVSDRKSE